MPTEVFSNVAAASGLRRSSRLLAVSVSNVKTNLATPSSINTRKSLKRKKVQVDDVSPPAEPPKAKRKRETSRKTSTDITDSIENLQRKRQAKPEPVYDIPDVEKRETSFRGRLGIENFYHCFFEFFYLFKQLSFGRVRMSQYCPAQ